MQVKLLQQRIYTNVEKPLLHDMMAIAYMRYIACDLGIALHDVSTCFYLLWLYEMEHGTVFLFHLERKL